MSKDDEIKVIIKLQPRVEVDKSQGWQESTEGEVVSLSESDKVSRSRDIYDSGLQL